ncbi:hypothetical protein AB1Y20_007720 [Prymnesium parvum]|uniref:PDZ domain-containing protein n=1 Tax=Prymnesium parvum TaxID=97485 RepID=A0AB34IVU3_PRYPA
MVPLLIAASLGFRLPAVRMGLFDGAKEAFSTNAEKPLVAADRVTPFDKWLGLDKALVEAERPEQVTFIDPNKPENYLSLELSKPMGIAFIENEGDCGGICVEGVLEEGSASSSSVPLQEGDQLVAVNSVLVLGNDFDSALDTIKNTEGETVKLTFFRGPTSFLYGPTAPSAEWYASVLL